jgi:hypothetical protein
MGGVLVPPEIRLGDRVINIAEYGPKLPQYSRDFVTVLTSEPHYRPDKLLRDGIAFGYATPEGDVLGSARAAELVPELFDAVIEVPEAA